MRLLFTAAGFSTLLLIGCGNISDEEMAGVTQACKEFVQKSMVRLGPFPPPITAKVFDVWKKNGSFVAEVGYKNQYGEDDYSVRYCVVDPEKGTISLPSVFNQSDWNK